MGDTATVDPDGTIRLLGVILRDLPNRQGVACRAITIWMRTWCRGTRVAQGAAIGEVAAQGAVEGLFGGAGGVVVGQVRYTTGISTAASTASAGTAECGESSNACSAVISPG